MARLLLTDVEWELMADDGERIPWPFALGGDKGYRADWIDELLLDLGIRPVIPSKKNQDRDARLVDFIARRTDAAISSSG